MSPKKKAKVFAPADYLDNPVVIAEYISAAFESNDPVVITRALGHVARARGMAEVAEKAGLGRESLYKALGGERSPSLDTVLRVLNALGLTLRAVETTEA